MTNLQWFGLAAWVLLSVMPFAFQFRTTYFHDREQRHHKRSLWILGAVHVCAVAVAGFVMHDSLKRPPQPSFFVTMNGLRIGLTNAIVNGVSIRLTNHIVVPATAA